MTSTRHKWLLIAAAVAVAASLHAQAGIDPSLYSGLRWRMIGPFRGGRVDAVSGVPGRPGEFYFGHVNGGVWKTINAGRTWTPIFDDQPVASIGALAVAPNQPDVVYVGTGESTLRDSNGYGNGVYKSWTPARTWTHLGLDATHHIGRVAIDPRMPTSCSSPRSAICMRQVRIAVSTRRPTAARRGRSRCSRTTTPARLMSSIDPANSRIVYASLWATRRAPWYTYAPSNSPGGGIYKSTDGGNTWTPADERPADRSGGPQRPRDRAEQPAACLRRGRCQGWRPLSIGRCRRDVGEDDRRSRACGDAAGTSKRSSSIPRTPTSSSSPTSAMQKSKDGGATFSTFAVRGSPGGDDYHQLWISPTNPDVMIVASDQGAVVTLNGTADTPEWSSWYNQPTAQLYTCRSRTASRGSRPARSRTAARCGCGRAASPRRSRRATGREPAPAVRAATPQPIRSIPTCCSAATVETCRLSIERSAAADITPPPGPDQARADWTQPLVFSQADPHALYYGSQYLYKTVDGGATWTRISEDLTRPEPGTPPTLDPTTAAMTDRNGRRGVIYTSRHHR